MEYEQALIIGKRRRADAAMALAGYVRERVTDLCAVKPSKDSGLDARDWDPVGEENFREVCIRRGPSGDEEAYLVVVDGNGDPPSGFVLPSSPVGLRRDKSDYAVTSRRGFPLRPGAPGSKGGMDGERQRAVKSRVPGNPAYGLSL